MWPSCDKHATTHHPHHRVGRPISWWTWDLRVPTLFFVNLFLSHCVLILLCLLCSGPMCACFHSRLGGQLYAPLCPVHISVPFTSMQIAALVTDTLQSPS